MKFLVGGVSDERSEKSDRRQQNQDERLPNVAIAAHQPWTPVCRITADIEHDEAYVL